MMPIRSSAVRHGLGGLLVLLAVNAFAGGYYGMSGAQDVPTAWLERSPFDSYAIPGLILFVAVGGSSLLAGLAVLAGARGAPVAALGAAAVTMVWIAAQVAIIGPTSWLQPTVVGVALVIAALAFWLDRAEPPRASRPPASP
jgi:hypothetical protein